MTRARVLAFHLPQFHPISENDDWWGKGFTEWTNVAKARPLFWGHEQPLFPSELGYYDLRLPEVRHAQAALAASHGVEAFCYWHYWFAGRRVLEGPVDALLAPGEPDFPFCLAWANQSWTGIWHGSPGQVLLEQTYPGPDDERAHFEALLPFFTDPRYVRVDGRPLFYVFRPEELPDPLAWSRLWQDMARAAGLPGLYLVAEISDLTGAGPVWTQTREAGFDDALFVRIPVRRNWADQVRMRFRRKVRGGPEVLAVQRSLPEPPPSCSHALPCVYPNWDNTPRSSRRGLVMRGSHPVVFAGHVEEAIGRLQDREPDQRLLFVKSWNEWAEGNHLEPDAVHGRAWLEAVRDAVKDRPA